MGLSTAVQGAAPPMSDGRDGPGAPPALVQDRTRLRAPLSARIRRLRSGRSIGSAGVRHGPERLR